jgi:hypothetical protein
VNDFDRQLIDLISDLTDEGQFVPLRSVLDDYGPKLAARAIADGFAVVHQAPLEGWNYHDVLRRILREQRFLPEADALALVERQNIDLDYFMAAAPWAIALEEMPSLVFRYAADDPEAVAEVRSRTENRREAWEQTCR